MTDRVYTIDEIRSMVLPLLERYGMDSASLFGSYARGEADAASDIDVILYGGEDFDASGSSVWRSSFTAHPARTSTSTRSPS